LLIDLLAAAAADLAALAAADAVLAALLALLTAERTFILTLERIVLRPRLPPFLDPPLRVDIYIYIKQKKLFN
jgi:hypothetical protein